MTPALAETAQCVPGDSITGSWELYRSWELVSQSWELTSRSRERRSSEELVQHSQEHCMLATL
jgi:hypothetical protein